MKSSRGFTWLELLIVIALLGALMMLLSPRVGEGLSTNRKAQAENDVVQIAVAITVFQSEYGHLPSTNANIQELSGPLLQTLTGAASAINPRQIVFLEVQPAKKDKSGIRDGVFVDPWGSPYKLKLDTDSDGKLENVGPTSNLTAVLANKVVAVWNDPSTHTDRADEKKKRKRAVNSWD
jgi:prepilin-type N-terminal cleavage/methylation domain-containing protein